MFHVAALYKFANIADPQSLKDEILPGMRERGISGTIICAPEGVNGTVAGSKDALDWLTAVLSGYTGLQDGDIKWSMASDQPFKRTKVKVKEEIVTLRAPDIDPVGNTGEFVNPAQWNAILENPEIVVLDTRNFYETEIGSFKGAIDPKTDSFTDFPDFVDKHLDPETNKQVAMFCTGGIRCEKASALMRQKGFEKVYQLHGGILKYLEDVPEDQSLWEGECFVFDDRVAVSHGLREGSAKMCWGCGYPLTVDDQSHPHYEDGVSCARCYDQHSEERKQVLRERHARLITAKQEMSEAS